MCDVTCSDLGSLPQRALRGLCVGWVFVLLVMAPLPWQQAASAQARTCWARVNDSPVDYATVQDAVDAAAAGDTVKVAGTCAGVVTRLNTNQTARIGKSLTVRGGYTSTNWTTSDPAANPTTLDAVGGGRVFFISGTNVDVTVEGLRITRGVAPGGAGGGITVSQSRVTIRNNEIYGNSARHGGGINVDRASGILSGNNVHDNTAEFGGGIRLTSSPITVSGNTLSGNVGDGGGLYLANTNAATVSGNTITGNRGRKAPGQPEAHGGGVVLFNDNSTLTGNTITNNTFEVVGEGFGGGAYLVHSPASLIDNTVSGNTAYGAGGLFLEECNATLADNRILNNTAYDYAGGVFIQRSFATVRGNTFTGNIVNGNTVNGHDGYGNGGGLYIEGGQYPAGTVTSATVRDNLFQGNSAAEQGGGVYLWRSAARVSENIIAGNSAKYGGGLFLISTADTLVNNWVVRNQATVQAPGMYIAGSTPVFLHTTLADNTGGDGTAVLAGSDNLQATTRAAFTNTIIKNQTRGVWAVTNSRVDLANTLWDGVPTYSTGTVVRVQDYTGDPLFVNPAGTDYHLGNGSAALDRGAGTNVTIDIDGRKRSQGGGPDLGADEVGNAILQLDPRAYLPFVVKRR